ncbi:UDP-N-acetylglucosamine 2-epimerase (non-hydrolyzing) [Herbaspirillum sp. WKF16]|uniref:non-hydrolyzing UDP-N-acetylglucosamine 2-epimerase n=1 Tax=Herbaspirillum sp. WKF16 TaxID=3028312 RepID=UPI0023A9FA1E|nr:UDP-N-acetylglucosamine 2-epimerase (non-hydrolyzing) [Herbaspirillum sp. WKF16]WDZ96606.1 UDP-N-acetylglucosamine 2-epimerase (non-hydrolyzing) [Herbaspirillum sp. WKF16]
MKIVTVVGARPQFIKAAAVSRAIAALPGAKEILLHTGQHYDNNMSDIFFDELGIPRPDYHLGVHGGGHGQMTGQMLIKIEEVLIKEAPDWVLVYGDTNSTLAGALAASKLHIPIAHVEAGLRSFNRRMPEEVNRVLTDHISTLLFAPTDSAVKNLAQEGVSQLAVRRVGDVMFDAALYYGRVAEASSTILQATGLQAGLYALATIHRSENTDDPQRLRQIIECLNHAAGHLDVVLPLHPRTRAAMERLDGGGRLSDRISVIDPVGYLDMVMLEKHARVIVTDSGGVQKEAYFHRVPCITLRDETEWVELVDCQWNTLVGTDAKQFKAGFEFACDDSRRPQWIANLYGDGSSAAEIARQLNAGTDRP